jgi:DNA repair exonuclease SbcCD ATPase subunit
MQKRAVVYFSIASFFLLSVSSVWAVVGDTRQNLRATASAERQNLIQQRQEIRTQFLEKLNTIRDARKKAIVEKLENRMNEINKKRTEEMLKHLEKMGEILNRIEQKGNEGSVGSGGSITQAVVAARTAIETARTAIETQAGKTYTPVVVNEATLRGVVGQSLAALQADLKAVREKVILAKKTVMDAYLAFAKMRGNVNVTPIATESGR